MKARMRDWVTRPLTVLGFGLAVVGLLFLLMEAQSPSKLYWTGQAVAGTNSGGLVYYRYHGEQYTIDDTGPVPAHDTAVTVYLDPNDPSTALLQKPTRWIDAAGVAGWFVASVACLLGSALAMRRRRAAAHRARARYGGGLDSDWVSRHLKGARPPE